MKRALVAVVVIGVVVFIGVAVDPREAAGLVRSLRPLQLYADPLMSLAVRHRVPVRRLREGGLGGRHIVWAWHLASVGPSLSRPREISRVATWSRRCAAGGDG